MITPRSVTERRILQAVMCVLTGAGCGPTEARAPVPPDDPIVPATTSPATMPEPPQNAKDDPRAFCLHYKEVVAATPVRPPTPQQVGQRVEDTAYWDDAANGVRCKVIREEEEEAIVSLLESTVCCPMPGDDPCSPPSMVDEPGIRQTVEEALVGPDGTIRESRIQMLVMPKNPRMMHNCGRRPAGFASESAAEGADVPAVTRDLAEMAMLERASVGAFDRLAVELRAHGAPDDLVERAIAAREDEVRHAAAVGALADRYGAPALASSEAEKHVRPLFDVALENAVEGCVREAYGALVATYQAACALPSLRPMFLEVAADERRHAALAEDVHAWIAERLGPEERRIVSAARAEARRELVGDVGSARACEILGLPSPAAARALLDAYFG